MTECVHCGATDEREKGISVYLRGGLNEPTCTVCRTDELRQETVLSPRQAEIQAFMEAGLARGGIAECLGISPNTVDEHKQAIKEKIRRAEGTLQELSTEGVT